MKDCGPGKHEFVPILWVAPNTRHICVRCKLVAFNVDEPKKKPKSVKPA